MLKKIIFQFSPYNKENVLPVQLGSKYGEFIQNSETIDLFLNSNLVDIDGINTKVKSAIFSFILSSEGYVQAVPVSQFIFTLELALLPKVTVLVPWPGQDFPIATQFSKLPICAKAPITTCPALPPSMASVVPQPEPIHTPLVQVVPDVSAAL